MSAAEIERKDVQALADAFVARMEWPSMHWRTKSLDPEAAYALALLALQHAPDLIAAGRLRERAMREAVAR